MQILIALLGFAVLASVHVRRHLAKGKKARAAHSTVKENKALGSSNRKAAHASPLDDETSHSGIWLFTMYEFHKLQCCYVIVLLIASFVALYGSKNPDKAQLEDLFLLIISADDLIHVAPTLYPHVVSPYHAVSQGLNHHACAPGLCYWFLESQEFLSGPTRQQ